MGQYMDSMKCIHSGFGDTEDLAVNNLTQKMAQTLTDIKSHKNYYMVHKYDGITSGTTIKVQLVDGVFNTQTHLYGELIKSEGATESKALKLLTDQVKARCEDAYAGYNYTITCNDKTQTSIKDYNYSVNTMKIGEKWQACC